MDDHTGDRPSLPPLASAKQSPRAAINRLQSTRTLGVSGETTTSQTRPTVTSPLRFSTKTSSRASAELCRMIGACGGRDDVHLP
eukprot:6175860-Pleurochrysis_carterae.AAC.1